MYIRNQEGPEPCSIREKKTLRHNGTNAEAFAWSSVIYFKEHFIITIMLDYILLHRYLVFFLYIWIRKVTREK